MQDWGVLGLQIYLRLWFSGFDLIGCGDPGLAWWFDISILLLGDLLKTILVLGTWYRWLGEVWVLGVCKGLTSDWRVWQYLRECINDCIDVGVWIAVRCWLGVWNLLKGFEGFRTGEWIWTLYNWTAVLIWSLASDCIEAGAVMCGVWENDWDYRWRRWRHILLLRGGRRGFDPRQLRRTKRAFFPPLAIWNEA